MSLIKDEPAIKDMRKGGRILASILDEIRQSAAAGITTLDIENSINRLCLKHNVKPAFKGFQPAGSKPYAFSSCISVNEEVVHGLPSSRKILNGDIVTIDMGIILGGYITDAAVTFPVGDVQDKDLELIKVTEGSMYAGIDQIRDGARVGDISFAIYDYCEKRGYNVFKSLAGHGVGKSLHEDPTIPNFGDKGTGTVLKAGMTLAIETMVTKGSGELRLKPDGWTLQSLDGERAAQAEHTVLVTQKGFEILTVAE